ncbi:hypothetical protein [Pedobacter sp.]|uniref:hypothetical protein n=1 Tax=Pedobacter sp. TaxID=1411316 RepID=UPI003C3144A4
MKTEINDQYSIDNGYAPGKKSFEYLAKSIGESFDFKLVHKAMLAVEWKWSFGTDKYGIENYGIPTLDTIKQHAARLLKEAYDKDCSISTGGFSAGWDSGELYLLFQLESASEQGIVIQDDDQTSTTRANP